MCYTNKFDLTVRIFNFVQCTFIVLLSLSLCWSGLKNCGFAMPSSCQYSTHRVMHTLWLFLTHLLLFTWISLRGNSPYVILSWATILHVLKHTHSNTCGHSWPSLMAKSMYTTTGPQYKTLQFHIKSIEYYTMTTFSSLISICVYGNVWDDIDVKGLATI